MFDDFVPFNDKQLAFIAEFGETIEFAMLEGQFLTTWRVLEKLENYEPFQKVFRRWSAWFYLKQYFDERSGIDLTRYNHINLQLQEIFQLRPIDPMSWDIVEPQAEDVFNSLQLTFLNRYSEAIVIGATASKFFHGGITSAIVDDWDVYRVLFYFFGGWDNVLDYFEDTSIYDRELRRELEQQLRKLSSWL